jgi:hypothetical protein
MLHAQSVLDRALLDAQPKTPVDLALQTAALRVAAVRRRQRWWTVAPLAAAAGVAGLLLLGRGDSDLPGEMWQPQPAVVVSGIDVEAPSGQDVVVFDIEDRPDVVVVWFFDKGDE